MAVPAVQEELPVRVDLARAAGVAAEMAAAAAA